MWSKIIRLILLDEKHCEIMPFHCIITRGSVSDVLNSQYKKPISGGEKSNKRKRKEGNKEDNH
jgi:hypothetical protein